MEDVNYQLASLRTGITYIQQGVDKVYNYLEALATYTLTPLLIHPSKQREILTNIK